MVSDRGEPTGQRERTSRQGESFSCVRVNMDDTGKVDRAMAANHSLGSSLSAEPQVTSAALAAVVSSMAVDWLGFGYAALVATGGLIGYAKAGSVPSLAAGLLFGSFAGLGAYQLSQNPNNVWISLIC
ncbi:uncharacterized protein LOC134137231 isoform X3 [Rhea pennata]|uniref:uncharacterized protein LOC134137231 isoform X3 n=1 Tax=Rhea pennata TaxID=8795 RepID=UPI002E265F70